MISNLDSIKVGDVLYDVHRYKLAHVKASREGCWEVFVLELPNEEHPHTWKVGWNLRSQVRMWTASQMRKLRRKPKETRSW